MRNILTTTALILTTLSATAQDKIYQSNGETINAKVITINNREVKYKRYENVDGPIYAIRKSEIEKIVYENGTEDIINGTDNRRTPHAYNQSSINYGNNVIAISPFQVSEEGLGAGLSYERSLDQKGIVSFYLPLIWAYRNATTYNYLTGKREDYNTFYAEPGVKFYPTGSKGKVRYAVGPSLMIATAERAPGNYNEHYTTVDTKQFTLGILVNNSLNINPSQHLYLGLELGLGLSYINRIDGAEQDTKGIVHFGFKVGFRF